MMAIAICWSAATLRAPAVPPCAAVCDAWNKPVIYAMIHIVHMAAAAIAARSGRDKGWGVRPGPASSSQTPEPAAASVTNSARTRTGSAASTLRTAGRRQVITSAMNASSLAAAARPAGARRAPGPAQSGRRRKNTRPPARGLDSISSAARPQRRSRTEAPGQIRSTAHMYLREAVRTPAKAQPLPAPARAGPGPGTRARTSPFCRPAADAAAPAVSQLAMVGPAVGGPGARGSPGSWPAAAICVQPADQEHPAPASPPPDLAGPAG